MRISLFLAVALSLALSASGLCATDAPFDQAAYAQPQRLVDIGGRRMNLYCTGSGSPTVVLDAGGGSWSLTWRYVQPLIAQTTRVCSYDRAGLGFSDAGPMPRTTLAIVDDLHALLHRAGISAPYVLVGHSMGGYDMRVFADLYGPEVAGMVLVDPSSEDSAQEFGKILPIMTSIDFEQLPQMKTCAAAAAAQNLRPATQAYATCIPPPNPEYSAQLQGALTRMLMQEKTWDALISELENVRSVDPSDVRREQRSYGQMPLIVLTGGAQFKQYQGLLHADDAQVLALQNAWNDMHEKIASLSAKGINRKVPGAGHDIQVSHPDAVVDAVKEVIEEASGSR